MNKNKEKKAIKISEREALGLESVTGTPIVILFPWFIQIIYFIIVAVVVGVLVKKKVIEKD
jgi:hypothetical protein